MFRGLKRKTFKTKQKPWEIWLETFYKRNPIPINSLNDYISEMQFKAGKDVGNCKCAWIVQHVGSKTIIAKNA